MKLHAQPYAYGAAGFYFETPEEFDKKFAAAERKGVEEFEIDLIDGTDAEAQLFAAAGVYQGDVHKFFHFIDALGDESEQAAAFYALEYLKKDMDEALRLAEEELHPFHGDVEDYVYDFIAGMGGVGELGKETIENYFDYEAFGRDLGFDLDADNPDDAEYIEMDDAERGEAFIESAGISILFEKPRDKREAPLGERYFDYEAYARDLALGGDVQEFEFAGSTWTIPSY